RSPPSLMTDPAHNGGMTDRDEVWSQPTGDDSESGLWWTPPTASSGTRPAPRSRSWRTTSPSWTMLVLVSAVTAVLGGTIGGVIAHQGSSASDSAPKTVRLGAPTVPVT